VTRKVDGDERAAERHGDGVPGVGVLGTAVQEHQLGRGVAPHERAQPAAGADLDLLPADGGRTVVREAELLRVLVEEPELVVRDPFDHGRQHFRTGAPALYRRALMGITAARLEGTVRVRAGRKLGIAEFGTPDGQPIIWFHGTPGARRQIPEEARKIADARGLRIVGIDRPGVGLSTPHQYEDIFDFVTDLEIVVDQLGIERFAAIALSGGAPYAMAAAAGLPGRVPAVGILGGVVPSVGPDAPPGGWVGFAKRFRSCSRWALA